MAKAVLVAQFLRAQAWLQLDGAGPNALRVARCVVSLLDAAAYLRDVPDDDPALRAMELAGCFLGGVFDPGPEGAALVRDWQLADEQTAGPTDLMTALAKAATRTPPGGPLAPAPEAIPANAIPPQVGMNHVSMIDYADPGLT